MANLQNKKIFETYKSIIGIGSAGTNGVTGTPQALTDGLGVEIPIEVSETEVNVTAQTLQVRSLTVDGYGEVINDQGEWLGVGAAGSSGTSGSSGTVGPVGPPGPAGSQGTSGSTGSSGSSGSSGTRGTSGTSGSSGSSGTRGVAGSSGTSGTAGTSGANGDRYLTTSTTNLAITIATKTLTVGTGLSYSIAQKVLIAHDASNFMEGTITSYNPANGAMVANITIVTGTGSFSAWTVNLAGASGGDGSSGTSGTAGTSGIDGTSGTSGINGTSGTSGVSGTDGTSGTSGTSGSTGTSGTSGIDGSSGTSGTSGTSGIDGSSGTSGIDGSSGTSGVNGTSGTAGTSGTSGTTGTSGTSGLGYPVNGQILSLTNNTIGATGTFVFNLVSPYTSANFAFASGQYVRAIQQVDAGLNWMEGVLVVTSSTQYTLYVDNYNGSGSYNQWSFAISGADGSDGTSGTSGSNGSSGSSGTRGTSGTSGTSGANGTSGSSGTRGTSGTSGVNGTSGTSGSSGVVSNLNSYTSEILNPSIAPAGNLYTSPKMFGLAIPFTPNSTGKVQINLSGLVDSASSDTLSYRLVYGTGTAPANGASFTGTAIGPIAEFNPSTPNADNANLNTILSGLTLSTQYWIDVYVYATFVGAGSTPSVEIRQSQVNIIELAGVQGQAGTSGSVGTSGTSGSTGTSGTSGQDGTFFGSSGTSGSSGTTGTSGTSGINGTSGTSGVSGSSGTTGTSGSSGTSGFSGANGSSGTSGNTGSSGTSGIAGSSGTSGAIGVTGSNGTSGTSGSNGVGAAILPVYTKTSNYSIVVADTGSLIEMSSGTAKTISVPLDSAQNFQTGSQIVLVRGGVASVTIVPTSGVTVNSAGGFTRLASQYSSATLVKKSANTWYLFGDIN